MNPPTWRSSRSARRMVAAIESSIGAMRPHDTGHFCQLPRFEYDEIEWTLDMLRQMEDELDREELVAASEETTE